MSELQGLEPAFPSKDHAVQRGGGLLGALDAYAPPAPARLHQVISREVLQGPSQPAPARPQLELEPRVTGVVRLVQALSRSWALSSSQLANLLAYSSETLIPALVEGRLTFVSNPDRATRLQLLYSMHVVLANLFSDPADEARWLRDRLPILGNLSPLDYMLQNHIPGILRLQQIVERDMANR